MEWRLKSAKLDRGIKKIDLMDCTDLCKDCCNSDYCEEER